MSAALAIGQDPLEALLAERAEVKKQIDAHYWRFTRTSSSRGAWPSDLYRRASALDVEIAELREAIAIAGDASRTCDACDDAPATVVRFANEHQCAACDHAASLRPCVVCGAQTLERVCSEACVFEDECRDGYAEEV